MGGVIQLYRWSVERAGAGMTLKGVDGYGETKTISITKIAVAAGGFVRAYSGKDCVAVLAVSRV